MSEEQKSFSETVVEKISHVLYDRAYEIYKMPGVATFLTAYKSVSEQDKILVGGGIMAGGKTSDIDFFPLEPLSDDVYASISQAYSETHLTANALTIVVPEGKPIQFCKYSAPDPHELVKTFDFAHIQVAALIGTRVHHVYDVAFTPEFVAAQIEKRTWYTGSEYPLSSLVRAHKYRSRGWMTSMGYRVALVGILADIAERGFSDRADLRAQLDGIDLTAYTGKDGDRLFEALRRDR